MTALLAPKGKSEPRPVERIEILGTPQRGPDVNVVLASKSKRRRDEGSDGPRDGYPPAPLVRARIATVAAMARSADAADGARRERSDAAGPGGPGTDGGSRRRTGPARPGGRESGGRDNPRRLAPSTTYRNAALATLKPEQLPVAEQLLRGGIPSVRQAIEEQNTRARAESRPEVTPGPLLAMAEQLLPVSTWPPGRTAPRWPAPRARTSRSASSGRSWPRRRR